MNEMTITWKATGKYEVRLTVQIFMADEGKSYYHIETAGRRHNVNWSGDLEMDIYVDLIDDLANAVGLIKLETLGEIKRVLSVLCSAHDEAIKNGLRSIDGTLRMEFD